jgi:hypothetical protein
MFLRSLLGLLSRRPASTPCPLRVREHQRGKPRGGRTVVRANHRFGRRAG